ncbi:uncharacterized protein LOC116244880 [Nymphaea colorata]|nr:uncharacterized protein LOC116244880 [Nymphaea colorata]
MRLSDFLTPLKLVFNFSAMLFSSYMTELCWELDDLLLGKATGEVVDAFIHLVKIKTHLTLSLPIFSLFLNRQFIAVILKLETFYAEAKIGLHFDQELCLELLDLCEVVFNQRHAFFFQFELNIGMIGPIDLVGHPEKLQNIRGVIFFLVASNAFGGIQGTLATFASERPVFLRERFSKSYTTFTYFLSRTAINFPFELVYPTAGAIIIYWATSFGAQTAEECFKLVAMVNGVYFCSASYGLLYAALIPKLETAMALVPVLIIPFMLLGGFFINLDNVDDIRVIFYPIMYLSPFKYGSRQEWTPSESPRIFSLELQLIYGSTLSS